MALAVAAGGGVVVHAITTSPGRAERAGYRINDCVDIAPSADGLLHASKTSCNTDPSFEVSAYADAAGHCRPDRFDRFGPPRADPDTGTLCLEPNLLAGHCYRFGDPVGMWKSADCGAAGPAVIKVTKRVDVDDDTACSTGAGELAMAYPAPPRTYCTAPAR